MHIQCLIRFFTRDIWNTHITWTSLTIMEVVRWLVECFALHSSLIETYPAVVNSAATDNQIKRLAIILEYVALEKG